MNRQKFLFLTFLIGLALPECCAQNSEEDLVSGVNLSKHSTETKEHLSLAKARNRKKALSYKRLRATIAFLGLMIGTTTAACYWNRDSSDPPQAKGPENRENYLKRKKKSMAGTGPVDIESKKLLGKTAFKTKKKCTTSSKSNSASKENANSDLAFSNVQGEGRGSTTNLPPKRKGLTLKKSLDHS